MTLTQYTDFDVMVYVSTLRSQRYNKLRDLHLNISYVYYAGVWQNGA